MTEVIPMDIENVNLAEVQDENYLRKLWQTTPDFNEKRRIRARMSKLREQRLKEFYMSNDVMGDSGNVPYKATAKDLGYGVDPGSGIGDVDSDCSDSMHTVRTVTSYTSATPKGDLESTRKRSLGPAEKEIKEKIIRKESERETRYKQMSGNGGDVDSEKASTAKSTDSFPSKQDQYGMKAELDPYSLEASVVGEVIPHKVATSLTRVSSKSPPDRKPSIKKSSVSFQSGSTPSTLAGVSDTIDKLLAYDADLPEDFRNKKNKNSHVNGDGNAHVDYNGLSGDRMDTDPSVKRKPSSKDMDLHVTDGKLQDKSKRRKESSDNGDKPKRKAKLKARSHTSDMPSPSDELSADFGDYSDAEEEIAMTKEDREKFYSQGQEIVEELVAAKSSGYRLGHSESGNKSPIGRAYPSDLTSQIVHARDVEENIPVETIIESIKTQSGAYVPEDGDGDIGVNYRKNGSCTMTNIERDIIDLIPIDGKDSVPKLESGMISGPGGKTPYTPTTETVEAGPKTTRPEGRSRYSPEKEDKGTKIDPKRKISPAKSSSEGTSPDTNKRRASDVTGSTKPALVSERKISDSNTDRKTRRPSKDGSDQSSETSKKLVKRNTSEALLENSQRKLSTSDKPKDVSSRRPSNTSQTLKKQSSVTKAPDNYGKASDTDQNPPDQRRASIKNRPLEERKSSTSSIGGRSPIKLDGTDPKGRIDPENDNVKRKVGNAIIDRDYGCDIPVKDGDEDLPRKLLEEEGDYLQRRHDREKEKEPEEVSRKKFDDYPVKSNSEIPDENISAQRRNESGINDKKQVPKSGEKEEKDLDPKDVKLGRKFKSVDENDSDANEEIAESDEDHHGLRYKKARQNMDSDEGNLSSDSEYKKPQLIKETDNKPSKTDDTHKPSTQKDFNKPGDKNERRPSTTDSSTSKDPKPRSSTADRKESQPKLADRKDKFRDSAKPSRKASCPQVQLVIRPGDHDEGSPRNSANRKVSLPAKSFNDQDDPTSKTTPRKFSSGGLDPRKASEAQKGRKPSRDSSSPKTKVPEDDRKENKLIDREKPRKISRDELSVREGDLQNDNLESPPNGHETSLPRNGITKSDILGIANLEGSHKERKSSNGKLSPRRVSRTEEKEIEPAKKKSVEERSAPWKNKEPLPLTSPSETKHRKGILKSPKTTPTSDTPTPDLNSPTFDAITKRMEETALEELKNLDEYLTATNKSPRSNSMDNILAQNTTLTLTKLSRPDDKHEDECIEGDKPMMSGDGKKHAGVNKISKFIENFEHKREPERSQIPVKTKDKLTPKKEDSPVNGESNVILEHPSYLVNIKEEITKEKTSINMLHFMLDEETMEKMENDHVDEIATLRNGSRKTSLTRDSDSEREQRTPLKSRFPLKEEGSRTKKPDKEEPDIPMDEKTTPRKLSASKFAKWNSPEKQSNIPVLNKSTGKFSSEEIPKRSVKDKIKNFDVTPDLCKPVKLDTPVGEDILPNGIEQLHDLSEDVEGLVKPAKYKSYKDPRDPKEPEFDSDLDDLADCGTDDDGDFKTSKPKPVEDNRKKKMAPFNEDLPQDAVTFPDGSIEYPDGTVIHPDGVVEHPDGVLEYADGSKESPDGVREYPNGVKGYPGGVKVHPDGVIEYPDGTVEYPDGTIEHPDGKLEYPDGTIEYPGEDKVSPMDEAPKQSDKTPKNTLDKVSGKKATPKQEPLSKDKPRMSKPKDSKRDVPGKNDKLTRTRSPTKDNSKPLVSGTKDSTRPKSQVVQEKDKKSPAKENVSSPKPRVTKVNSASKLLPNSRPSDKKTDKDPKSDKNSNLDKHSRKTASETDQPKKNKNDIPKSKTVEKEAPVARSKPSRTLSPDQKTVKKSRQPANVKDPVSANKTVPKDPSKGNEHPDDLDSKFKPNKQKSLSRDSIDSDLSNDSETESKKYDTILRRPSVENKKKPNEEEKDDKETRKPRRDKGYSKDPDTKSNEDIPGVDQVKRCGRNYPTYVDKNFLNLVTQTTSDKLHDIKSDERNDPSKKSPTETKFDKYLDAMRSSALEKIEAVLEKFDKMHEENQKKSMGKSLLPLSNKSSEESSRDSSPQRGSPLHKSPNRTSPHDKYDNEDVKPSKVSTKTPEGISEDSRPHSPDYSQMTDELPEDGRVDEKHPDEMDTLEKVPSKKLPPSKTKGKEEIPQKTLKKAPSSNIIKGTGREDKPDARSPVRSQPDKNPQANKKKVTGVSDKNEGAKPVLKKITSRKDQPRDKESKPLRRQQSQDNKESKPLRRQQSQDNKESKPLRRQPSQEDKESKPVRRPQSQDDKDSITSRKKPTDKRSGISPIVKSKPNAPAEKNKTSPTRTLKTGDTKSDKSRKLSESESDVPSEVENDLMDRKYSDDEEYPKRAARKEYSEDEDQPSDEDHPESITTRQGESPESRKLSRKDVDDEPRRPDEVPSDLLAPHKTDDIDDETTRQSNPTDINKDKKLYTPAMREAFSPKTSQKTNKLTNKIAMFTQIIEDQTQESRSPVLARKPIGQRLPAVSSIKKPEQVPTKYVDHPDHSHHSYQRPNKPKVVYPDDSDSEDPSPGVHRVKYPKDDPKSFSPSRSPDRYPRQGAPHEPADQTTTPFDRYRPDGSVSPKNVLDRLGMDQQPSEFCPFKRSPEDYPSKMKSTATLILTPPEKRKTYFVSTPEKRDEESPRIRPKDLRSPEGTKKDIHENNRVFRPIKEPPGDEHIGKRTPTYEEPNSGDESPSEFYQRPYSQGKPGSDSPPRSERRRDDALSPQLKKPTDVKNISPSYKPLRQRDRPGETEGDTSESSDIGTPRNVSKARQMFETHLARSANRTQQKKVYISGNVSKARNMFETLSKSQSEESSPHADTVSPKRSPDLKKKHTDRDPYSSVLSDRSLLSNDEDELRIYKSPIMRSGTNSISSRVSTPVDDSEPLTSFKLVSATLQSKSPPLGRSQKPSRLRDSDYEDNPNSHRVSDTENHVFQPRMNIRSPIQTVLDGDRSPDRIYSDRDSPQRKFSDPRSRERDQYDPRSPNRKTSDPRSRERDQYDPISPSRRTSDPRSPERDQYDPISPSRRTSDRGSPKMQHYDSSASRKRNHDTFPKMGSVDRDIEDKSPKYRGGSSSPVYKKQPLVGSPRDPVRKFSPDRKVSPFEVETFPKSRLENKDSESDDNTGITPRTPGREPARLDGRRTGKDYDRYESRPTTEDSPDGYLPQNGYPEPIVPNKKYSSPERAPGKDRTPDSTSMRRPSRGKERSPADGVEYTSNEEVDYAIQRNDFPTNGTTQRKKSYDKAPYEDNSVYTSDRSKQSPSDRVVHGHPTIGAPSSSLEGSTKKTWNTNSPPVSKQYPDRSSEVTDREGSTTLKKLERIGSVKRITTRIETQSFAKNIDPAMIDQIEDIDALNQMLEEATDYDVRFKIRSQIRKLRRANGQPTATCPSPVSDTKPRHGQSCSVIQRDSPVGGLRALKTADRGDEESDGDYPLKSVHKRANGHQTDQEGYEDGYDIEYPGDDRTPSVKASYRQRVQETDTGYVTKTKSSYSSSYGLQTSSYTGPDGKTVTETRRLSSGETNGRFRDELGPRDSSGKPMFGLAALKSPPSASQDSLSRQDIKSSRYDSNKSTPKGSKIDPSETNGASDTYGLPLFGGLAALRKKPNKQIENGYCDGANGDDVAKSSDDGHDGRKPRSFLEDHTPVSGIQDIISRMKVGDEEGEAEDDPRNLLNKFLGAQMLYTGAESILKSHNSKVGSSMSAPILVNNVNISSINDESILQEMLEKCKNREDEQKLTSRMKILRSGHPDDPKDKKGHGFQEEDSKVVREWLRNNYPEDKGTNKYRNSAEAVHTSSRTVLSSRVMSSREEGKGPISPFAKFKQLDAANSKSSPSSSKKPVGGPMYKFTNPALNRSASDVKDMLLYWCQCRTRDYKNVKIENFSTSWSDGLAFCALVHHFFPDSFDFDQLSPNNRRYNFTLAFNLAEEKANIAPLLEVDDMVRMRKPDWKCVFTYVQSMYRTLKDL